MKPPKNTRDQLRAMMQAFIRFHEKTLDHVPVDRSRTFALMAIAEALQTFVIDYEIVNGIYTDNDSLERLRRKQPVKPKE